MEVVAVAAPSAMPSAVACSVRPRVAVLFRGEGVLGEEGPLRSWRAIVWGGGRLLGVRVGRASRRYIRVKPRIRERLIQA